MKLSMIQTATAMGALAAAAGMTLASPAMDSSPADGGAVAAVRLAPLPYAPDALEPYISAKTIDFHYGKHHRAYLDNLNRLIAGTPLAGQPLEDILRAAAGAADKTAIFNNAAQVWNHTFFWQSMQPAGGGQPAGRMLALIEKSFGSLDAFRKAFLEAAQAQFGSGWVWLIQDGDKLAIVKTANADTPAARGQNALLTCDVWEHAYYLDYQNRRKDFVEAFLDRLANWDFAASRLKASN